MFVRTDVYCSIVTTDQIDICSNRQVEIYTISTSSLTKLPTQHSFSVCIRERERERERERGFVVKLDKRLNSMLIISYNC